MARVEHWVETGGDLVVVLAEVPGDATRTYGKQAAPGVVFSYAETPRGLLLTAIEVAPGPDRDMANLSFLRRDDDGNVILRVPANRVSDERPAP